MAIFPAHNLSKQVIDVYSRFVVGWDVFNTLDTKNSLSVLKKAIAKYGKPEIINSDQGCQFTSELWTSYLEKEVKDIKISMDSRGRTTDNAYIERLWRTVKRDYVYIYPAEDGVELYNGLKKFFIYYNTKKRHQGIGRETFPTMNTEIIIIIFRLNIKREIQLKIHYQWSKEWEVLYTMVTI